MDFPQLVTSFGWPGAILVILGLFGWQAMRYVGNELFSRELDKDSQPRGLLVRIVEDHRGFLKSTVRHIETNEDHMKHEEDCLKSMADSSLKTAAATKAISEGLGTLQLGQKELDKGLEDLAATWHIDGRCKFQTGGA